MNHSEAIASIREQLEDQQRALVNAQRKLAAQKARLADWLRTYRGPGHSAEADAAIADASSFIEAHQAEIANAESNIVSLNKALNDAIEAKETYDNNLAQAAREGLTGRAAELRAEALAQQQKILYTGLAISGVLLVIAAVWLMLKKKKAI